MPPTQSFSDKELARLKELFTLDEYVHRDEIFDLSKRMINRLEAAERSLNLHADPNCCAHLEKGKRHEECESYFDWRKAAGKHD